MTEENKQEGNQINLENLSDKLNKLKLEKSLEKKAKKRPPLDSLSAEEFNCNNPVCISLAWKFARMKDRLMARHNSVSLKWRDQSFYFKKKAKALETYLLSKGIDPASAIKEVFESKNNTINQIMKGSPDDNINNNSSAGNPTPPSRVGDFQEGSDPGL